MLTQVLGLHYDEAAEVLCCPVGTIRSRGACARVDLVEMMTDDTATADTAGDQRATGTDGLRRAT